MLVSRFVVIMLMSALFGPMTPASSAQDRAAGDLDMETITLTNAGGREIPVQRGTLVVPEHRANPDSKLITFAFVWMKGTGAADRAPMVYLAGGPGGSSTGMAGNPRALDGWGNVLDVCDVLLIDQRGTGQSEPDLTWRITDIPTDMMVDAERSRARMEEECRKAAAHFRAKGHDLDGYTTLEAAHDLNDLRQALGLEKLSLYGFSYGTHFAQTMIKYYGETLQNVIMVGVEGLDMTYKLPLTMDTAFRRLSLLVSKDERVAPHVPDLVALYHKVCAKLDAEPMKVTIRGLGNKPTEVEVGSFGLNMILRIDIGDASDLPVFPKLLYSIDQGDPRILRAFVQKRYPFFSRVNAMAIITDGASGASAGRMALINDQVQRSMFGNLVNMTMPDAAIAMGAPDLGEEFRTPIVSDVRTLFLTGSLDFNTPPYQAEMVRWGFTNSYHISVENAGHEQIFPQPGIQQAMLRFLQDEDVSDVHVALPPLRFVPIEGYDPEVTHWSVPRQ